MKILMIYAHPNDKSYNASILETVKENLSPKHELRILDLYKEQFDPVLRFDATTLITGTRRNSFSANARAH